MTLHLRLARSPSGLAPSRTAGALAAATLTLLAGCSNGGPSTASPAASPAPATGEASVPPDAATPVSTTPPAPPTGAPSTPPLTAPQDVVTGLTSPWGLAFLPDGSALVSQRDDGKILRIADHAATVVGTVPGAVHTGEGGLLGLAVAPTYSADHLMYAYLTTATDNRIVRMTYTAGGPLGVPQPVLTGIPKAANHNGGRLIFGPDGLLYASTGDGGTKSASQDLGSLAGKILRMTADGGIPAGNPFAKSPVYSYGHRNVQGLAFDSSGQLWASEFGQDTWDELNKIEAGKNYGWPIVEGTSTDARFVNPFHQWRTADASPSGIAIAGDTVYLAALRGSRLWRVPLAGGETTALYDGAFGRLRAVAVAPDGSLWLVTNNTDGRGSPRPGDDRIVRVPVPR